MNDEEIPYRTPVTPVGRGPTMTTANEVNYDTLHEVQNLLAEGVDGLNKWDAFDLTELEGMDIKQQIKAHQLAFAILSPALEAVKTAIQRVDAKYKER